MSTKKTNKKSDKHHEEETPVGATSDAPEGDIEHVIAGEPPPKEKVESKGKDPMFDKIRVTIPVALSIAGTDYPAGSHIIERHQLDTILEMVNKKQRANLAIFTGGNYLVEKMVGGALKVTEVAELSGKSLVGG